MLLTIRGYVFIKRSKFGENVAKWLRMGSLIHYQVLRKVYLKVDVTAVYCCY
jgi:hypothetical protein